ncbi:MAG: hypothetical protein U0003_05055 [Vampirovibrionales bacterium]
MSAIAWLPASLGSIKSSNKAVKKRPVFQWPDFWQPLNGWIEEPLQEFHLFCPREGVSQEWPQAWARAWDGAFDEVGHKAPLNLSSSPLACCLDKDSLLFALQQLPPIQSVVVAGWGEPFRYSQWSDWLAACKEAFPSKNHPFIELYSHADWDARDVQTLWQKPLDRLTVQMIGHSPASASLMAAASGIDMPWQVWQARHERLKTLLAQRPLAASTEVVVSVVVDAVSIFHLEPMVNWAKHLGVDALRLEGRFKPLEQDALALSAQSTEALIFLQQAQSAEWDLPIQWPTLPALASESSPPVCSSFKNRLSMTPELAINPCHRHWINQEAPQTIWEWGTQSHAETEALYASHGSLSTLPAPCKTCRHRGEQSL